ncbi:hypothetical protein PR048_029858 [Dryococelus australis]|uniref:DDE-1 domain-containing protein n=1 Tax=Dryococelus australis TaxID=614101 RepID=A0ABQ9G7C8_9NEOP|nr:hypothetical protein PR048_029858 [Dryococelus australis]
MPTGTRRTYPPDLLKQAVTSINEGKSIQLPQKSLKLSKCFFAGITGWIYRNKKKKVGRQLALSNDTDVMIAEHLKTMAKWGFALGKSEVLDVIADYVQQNELVIRFKNSRPGNDWFKTRRIPTSDPFIIYHFYGLFEKEVHNLELSDQPQSIFNLDETSFSVDPSRVKRVSGIGQKAHRIAEASTRENTTVMACVSASGCVLPPMIAFKSSNLWSTWKVNVVRRENVSILKMPAHTTGVIQPLDSLKYTWDLELVKWYRENQRKMMKSEFVSVMCRVWSKGMKPENPSCQQLTDLIERSIKGTRIVCSITILTLKMNLHFGNKCIKITPNLNPSQNSNVGGGGSHSSVSPVQFLSFQKLLVGKMRRTESDKKTRESLDPQGCVITLEEWLRIASEKQAEKEKLVMLRKRNHNVLEENECEVMGLKYDSDKQTFKKIENDLSVVKMKDIVGKLPFPNTVGVGDRFKYYFEKIVNVFEP